MSTLTSIAGKNGCGNEDSLTGKAGCQIEFGTPLHLFKLSKGFKMPGNTDFTLDYINSLIQNGTMTPLVDASSFEDLSAEDSNSSNSRGVERLNVQGLPKYRVMFEEGHEFYRQLSKLRGFKKGDFLIGDEYGNIKIAIDSTGNFSGFSAGQILPEKTKDKQFGGEGESKSLTIQFLNRIQWDENYTIIKNEQLGFDLSEVQGINPVTLNFDSIPSDTDSTIDITALLTSDLDTNLEGFDATNFSVSVDNVDNPVTNVTETNNVYTLTLTSALATGNVVTVNLYDGTENSYNIIHGGILYKSNTASETVVV